MDTYHLSEPVVTEFSHPLLGRIRASFDAGEATPTNEQELEALDRLVRRGLATVLDPDDDDDLTEEAPE